MKYRIYVDEVGNPDLESSDNPNHRFLSLTGIILELDYVKSTLHPQMEELKAKYFDYHPDEPIVFHRKEMVNALDSFRNLIHSEVRQKFDRELLHLLRTWQYVVITVCLDKKKHKETYTTWRYDPYHYCLAVLLERYALFLDRMGAHGDTMAESRGGKADLRLKDSFQRLWEQGTDYIAAETFRNTFTSCQLKVKPKANNIAGLQLADLIAHPSRNEILYEQGLFQTKPGRFAQQVIEILQSKYDRDSERVFGRKFI
jgi:hypothetical protein